MIASPPLPGFLIHSLDDIYFGSSRESVGIQLADICAWTIRAHLAIKTAVGRELNERSIQYEQDIERLYSKVEQHIFKRVDTPSECMIEP